MFRIYYRENFTRWISVNCINMGTSIYWTHIKYMIHIKHFLLSCFEFIIRKNHITAQAIIIPGINDVPSINLMFIYKSMFYLATWGTRHCSEAKRGKWFYFSITGLYLDSHRLLHTSKSSLVAIRVWTNFTTLDTSNAFWMMMYELRPLILGRDARATRLNDRIVIVFSQWRRWEKRKEWM